MTPAELDKARSELANDNELTLLAWVRTSAALLGFGCAIAQFALFVEQSLGKDQSSTYAAGIVLLLVAVAGALLGVEDYHRRRVAIASGNVEQARTHMLYPFAAVVGVAGLGLLGLLLWLVV